MKKIAKFISISIIVSGFIMSCNKNTIAPPTPANAIIVTIDGAVDTFNVNTKAEKIGTGTGAYTEIVGYAKNGDQLDLKLQNPSIAAGQKYVSTDVNGSYTYFCTLDISISNNWFGSGYGGNIGTDQNINVSISSITPTEIKGTFSGKIGDETNWVAEKTLTNGSFDVSF